MNMVLFMLLILASALEFSVSWTTPPPLPILPIPTRSQLKWQTRELIMFFHFGVNTFTDSEWGTGHEDPAIFNPTELDARQWVDVAANAGFSLVILTAKHHDGFCLWPSKYTDHSVASSPWRGGKGDVVGELAAAANGRGLDFGLYLSPWDRHERSYGKEKNYNEFYMGQLEELLNRYGSVSEIWFDGAKGSNAPNMTYYFQSWFDMVKELQGSINIFSDAGPDVRWVGDEKGYAGTTCWSMINRTSIQIGTSNVGYLNKGDYSGVDWVPAECDVSIRMGWFWHKSQKPKSLSHLLNIYYNSVGRNCVLLLNVPPNSSGLISGPDIQRLMEFRKAINTIFAVDLASGSSIKASSQRGGSDSSFGPINILDDDHLWTFWAPSEKTNSHWIELDWEGKEVRFNVVRIQEAVGLGQRIKSHEIYADGKMIVDATTVGYKRLHRLDWVVSAWTVRIRVVESRGVPLISSVGLYFDPFWHGKQ
ncbi:hypothetical protein AAC387_Pa08g0462 [Persea americana]